MQSVLPGGSCRVCWGGCSAPAPFLLQFLLLLPGQRQPPANFERVLRQLVRGAQCQKMVVTSQFVGK